MKQVRYRWKFNKDPVRVRQSTAWDGTVLFQIATGGDFRKGYITYTSEEFEKTFEKY